MATAANLRTQIEGSLSKRIPAAFSLKIKQPPELFSTGIDEADTILEGGIPRGSITEICGATSTGRTSFALSILSGITRAGAACAWVDVHDSLSPESAAASGIVLERLLWLRTKANTSEQHEYAPAQVNRRSVPSTPKRTIDHSGGSYHQRKETQGIDKAVSLLFKGDGGLLRDKTIGTPGRSNRPMSEPRCAETLSRAQRNEQVAYDRLPARRGDYLSKELADGKQVPKAHLVGFRASKQRSTMEKPWARLEQALKATDLLLQTGGFAAVVLDMCDVLPQQVARIPLASWYRFRLAAEQARTALILLTQSPCASSCAALVLRSVSASTREWSTRGETALFQNQHYVLVRERNRNEGSASIYKKPSVRAEWQAQTEWTRVR